MYQQHMQQGTMQYASSFFNSASSTGNRTQGESTMASSANFFSHNQNNQLDEYQFDSFVNDTHPAIPNGPMSLPTGNVKPPPLNAHYQSGPSSLDNAGKNSNPFRSQGRRGHTAKPQQSASLFFGGPASVSDGFTAATFAPSHSSNNAASFFDSSSDQSTTATAYPTSHLDSFVTNSSESRQTVPQNQTVMQTSTQKNYCSEGREAAAHIVDMFELANISALDKKKEEALEEEYISGKVTPIGRTFSEYPASDISNEKRRQAEEENNRLRAEKIVNRDKNLSNVNAKREELIKSQREEWDKIAREKKQNAHLGSSTNTAASSNFDQIQSYPQLSTAEKVKKPLTKEERKQLRERTKQLRSKRSDRTNQLQQNSDLGSLYDELSSRGGSICSDISERHHPEADRTLAYPLSNHSHNSSVSFFKPKGHVDQVSNRTHGLHTSNIDDSFALDAPKDYPSQVSNAYTSYDGSFISSESSSNVTTTPVVFNQAHLRNNYFDENSAAPVIHEDMSTTQEQLGASATRSIVDYSGKANIHSPNHESKKTVFDSIQNCDAAAYLDSGVYSTQSYFENKALCVTETSDVHNLRAKQSTTHPNNERSIPYTSEEELNTTKENLKQNNLERISDPESNVLQRSHDDIKVSDSTLISDQQPEAGIVHSVSEQSMSQQNQQFLSQEEVQDSDRETHSSTEMTSTSYVVTQQSSEGDSLSPYELVDKSSYPYQSSLNSNDSSPLEFVQHMSNASLSYEKVSIPNTPSLLSNPASQLASSSSYEKDFPTSLTPPIDSISRVLSNVDQCASETGHLGKESNLPQETFQPGMNFAKPSAGEDKNVHQFPSTIQSREQNKDKAVHLNPVQSVDQHAPYNKQLHPSPNTFQDNMLQGSNAPALFDQEAPYSVSAGQRNDFVDSRSKLNSQTANVQFYDQNTAKTGETINPLLMSQINQTTNISEFPQYAENKNSVVQPQHGNKLSQSNSSGHSVHGLASVDDSPIPSKGMNNSVTDLFQQPNSVFSPIEEHFGRSNTQNVATLNNSPNQTGSLPLSPSSLTKEAVELHNFVQQRQSFPLQSSTNNLPQFPTFPPQTISPNFPQQLPMVPNQQDHQPRPFLQQSPENVTSPMSVIGTAQDNMSFQEKQLIASVSNTLVKQHSEVTPVQIDKQVKQSMVMPGQEPTQPQQQQQPQPQPTVALPPSSDNFTSVDSGIPPPQFTIKQTNIQQPIQQHVGSSYQQLLPQPNLPGQYQQQNVNHMQNPSQPATSVPSMTSQQSQMMQSYSAQMPQYSPYSSFDQQGYNPESYGDSYQQQLYQQQWQQYQQQQMWYANYYGQPYYDQYQQQYGYHQYWGGMDPNYDAYSYHSSAASSSYGGSRPGSVIEMRSEATDDNILNELTDLTSEVSIPNEREMSPEREEVVIQRSTPLSFTRPHPCARFSTIPGLINIVLPKQPLDGEIACIQNSYMIDLAPHYATHLRKFPGPLVRKETHKKHIRTFILNIINEELPNLYQDPNQLFSQIALWEFVNLLVRQNGTFDGSDVADLLVGLLPATQHNGKESKQLSALADLPQNVSDESLEEFHLYISTGRMRDALDTAVRFGLWGHAFMLGTCLGDKTAGHVYTRFLKSLNKNDPMRTLYTHLQTKDVNMIKKKVNLDTWVQNLCVLISQGTNDPENDRQKVVAFGDALRAQGLTAAAQLCYLVAKIPFGHHKCKEDRLALLGFEHQRYTNKPAHIVSNNLNVQLTEIYQYALTLHDQSFVIPSFQPYKFEYAMQLIECGFSAEGMAYLESIALAIAQDRTFTLYQTEFVERLIKVAERLLLQEAEKIEDLEGVQWIENLKLYTQSSSDIPSVVKQYVIVPSKKNLSTDVSEELLPAITSPEPSSGRSELSSREDLSSRGNLSSRGDLSSRGNLTSTSQESHDYATHNDPQRVASGSFENSQLGIKPQGDQYTFVNDVTQSNHGNEAHKNDNVNYNQYSNNSIDQIEQLDYPDHSSNATEQQYVNEQGQKQHYHDYDQSTFFNPQFDRDSQQEAYNDQNFVNQESTANQTVYDYDGNNQYYGDNQYYPDNTQHYGDAYNNAHVNTGDAYEDDGEEEDLFGGFTKNKSKPLAEDDAAKSEAKTDNKTDKKDSNTKTDAKNSKGWFGGIFSKFQRKEVYLPDDKEKPLYYDDKLKRWVDKDADQSEETKPLPPPPIGSLGPNPPVTNSSGLPPINVNVRAPLAAPVVPVAYSIEPIASNEPLAGQNINQNRRSMRARQSDNSHNENEGEKKPVGPPSRFSLKAQGGRRGVNRYINVMGDATKSTPMAPVLDPFAGLTPNKDNLSRPTTTNQPGSAPITFFNPSQIGN